MQNGRQHCEIEPPTLLWNLTVSLTLYFVIFLAVQANYFFLSVHFPTCVNGAGSLLDFFVCVLPRKKKLTSNGAFLEFVELSLDEAEHQT